MTNRIRAHSPWHQPPPVLNALHALSYVIARKPAVPITGRAQDILTAFLLFFLAQLGIESAYTGLFGGIFHFTLTNWLGAAALWLLPFSFFTALYLKQAKLGSLLVVTLMATSVGTVLATSAFVYLPSSSYPFNLNEGGFMGVLFAAPLLISLPSFLANSTLYRARSGFALALATCIGIGVVSQNYGYAVLDAGLWASGATEEEYTFQSARPDPEIVYPLQPILMAAQIDQLRPQTKGEIDLYAVLGAGYPRQQIFQREVEALSNVLANTFDAKDRIIRLGATTRSPTGWPLLNRSNLTQGLAAIADHMDRNEDVALLFLTSHGMTNKISTRFYGLSHENLKAYEVNTALTASGIQNAVIVVSACYSGSFIDELKSPNRVVITASAADRNSFGCNDDRVYTVWGQAFIERALVQTQNLVEAARVTSSLVAEYESVGGLTPSLPQLHVGENVADKINRLALRFANPTVN
jgi:hypothetical protein